MNLSRRTMMKLSIAGVAATGLSGCCTAMAKKKDDKIKIGLQLYSLRKDCAKDFDKTLEQVAAMGFHGVEFAGYYKYAGNAKALRKKIDDLGIIAEGSHIRAHVFDDNKIQETIDFHEILGCKYLIIPGDRRFADPEKSKEYAELMNKTSVKLKPHNMYCGHHNHMGEFEKTGDGDKTYWDLFAERTNEDVVLQQDVGWSTAAHLDDAALVRKYPGRTKTTHFKPTALSKNMQPVIGKDSVKWKEIITACYDVGGTEWFVVEQEKYISGKSPVECTEMSLKGLNKILSDMGKA